jgi:hypothetical protein
MKSKTYLLSLPVAAAMAFTSCKKSEPAPVTPPETGSVTTPEVTPDGAPVAPPVTVNPSERAEKLGFARLLPKDTETLLLIQNGAEVSKRFQGSKLYSFIKSQSPEVDDIVKGDDTGGLTPMDILGLEVFLATGKSTGEQTGNLMNFSDRQTYFQMRSTMSMLIATFKGEEPDLSMIGGMNTMVELIKDSQSGLDLLKKSEMPPIYLGCKTTPENREKVLETISGLTANMAAVGAAVEEISFEVDGKKFSGNQIVGKKLVEDMMADESMVEGLTEQLGADTVEDLKKILSEKNLIVVTGMVDDYVVLFAGSRKEDLRLASSPADSLAASDALAFVDPYLAKNPVGVAYSDKGVLNGLLSSNGISTIANAMRDAIAGNGKVDTREIEAMLDVVSEREKELSSMYEASNFGMVAMLDEGFKIESFGGSNSPGLQAEVVNRMGDVGSSKETAVFVNWTSNPVYGIKMNAYIESLIETTYSITKNVSTWEVEENEMFLQFQQSFSMFEENFSDDLVNLWEALSDDMSDGLGNESAFVIDLNGEMPPIPGVPQELVKAGKFPRVSMVKPVRDRAKLAASWEKINVSGEGIMKQISTMMGAEQAMPKPMSSKQDSLTTWFFSGPLFTDDFAPSVTLDDKWFVMSTSKKHAAELAKKAETSNSGKTGAYMLVKFDALRLCAAHWIKAVDDNKEEIFKDNEFAAEDFTENKKMMNDLLTAFSELDELTLHTRKESGVERSTLHLKTR